MGLKRFHHSYKSYKQILLSSLLLLSLLLIACSEGKQAPVTTGPTIVAGEAKIKLVFWTQNRHDEVFMRQQFDLSTKLIQINLPAINKIAPAPSVKNYNYFLPDSTDAIWPVIPISVKIEGKDFGTVMADIVYGSESDPAQALKDLTNRYNKALNDGIAKGTHQKIILPNFNPLSLQRKE